MGRFERGLERLPRFLGWDAKSSMPGDGRFEHLATIPSGTPGPAVRRRPPMERFGPLVVLNPADFVHLNTAEGNVPLDELVAMDTDR